MSILAGPPSFILTDADGILVGSSAGTSLLTGGTEGQAPIVQGDGSIAWGAAGASSLSELNDWAADTLTVPGALTVRQAGGVAGTDEIQIYHDGTNGNIVPQSGNLYLSSSGSSGPYIDPIKGFTNHMGYNSSCALGGGTVFAQNDRQVLATRQTMDLIEPVTNGDGVDIPTRVIKWPRFANGIDEPFGISGVAIPDEVA